MKKKMLGSVLLGLCLSMGLAATAMADSRKVVTLGADLSPDQMNTMMRYFGVSYDSVDVIYINNTDEREHLGAYVPLEQIGNYTYSCALVAPTTSGGIQVKTANLEWVTCNMIASTLSTSGVTNCQVVAACPFKVSGTGALTGVIMAYEDASQETLDPVKVELANEELVTTGNLANEVGQSKATAVINETKTQIIENNITNVEEINNVINEVSNQYDVDINEDQSEQISALMQRIAEQEYDITQLKATLDRVQANVAGDAGASEEEQKAAEEQALASEQAALEAAQQEQMEQLLESGEAVVDENGVVIVDDLADWDNDESILENTDLSALEEAGGTVSEVDTTQTVQDQTEAEPEGGELWDDWDISIGDGTLSGDGGEALPGDGTEVLPGDGGEVLPDDGAEVLPGDGSEVLPGDGAEMLPGDEDEELPGDGAEVTPDIVTEEIPGGDAQAAPEGEAQLPGLTADQLDEGDRVIYNDVETGMVQALTGDMVIGEDGTQVYLSASAAEKLPGLIDQYLLKVLTQGAEAVSAMEAADPAISANIVEETAAQAPDADYENEEVKQIDRYVRRVVFKDSESILADSYLEETDKPVLYSAIMAVIEKAYHVEKKEEVQPEEQLVEDLPVEELPEDGADLGDGTADIDDEIIDDFLGDEFAESEW